MGATAVQSIRRELVASAADPYRLAAEAIERSNRLASELSRLVAYMKAEGFKANISAGLD